MLEWLINKKIDITPKEGTEDNKVLIHVYSKEIQGQIKQKYGMTIPIDRVFCTKDKFCNSSLWFEMWQPSKEYINK